MRLRSNEAGEDEAQGWGGRRRPCPGQVRVRVLVRVRSRCGLLGRAPRAGEAGASLDEAMSFFAALRGALATTRISRSCAVGHRGTCALGRRWPAAMHACGCMQGPPVCARVCMGCAWGVHAVHSTGRRRACLDRLSFMWSVSSGAGAGLATGLGFAAGAVDGFAARRCSAVWALILAWGGSGESV